ncbi:hypothetical protein ISCGN_030633 [Ixodes scapularis]
MRRQDPGNDYYTPDISLKSRGDFYGNVHDDDDDDVADGARKHTKSWATDKYDVFSPVWRSSKYRQSTTFESHAPSYRAHRAKEQWMPPYLVYRGKVEESLTPQTAKNVCGSLNKNKANAKAVDDAVERAVLSESSYYGDTSLEALSVLRKEDASDGRQAASERRRRSNDAGKNPVESETLAASSAIQTGANKVHERSASQKLDYPRFDDQSCKKDALEIEGLMPGDVDMDVLEKVAGPRYRGPNIPQQTEGDIVQAHRDYRMLGAVAPPSTSGLDAESEDGIHVLKALERLNQQLLDDKPRTSSLSSEQVVVEQRASEQRSSRPNGKRVPVSQEPLIVPASAATAKAIKPMRRTLSDQDVTPTQGMVTGLKYPYGRTSYEESKQRESRRNGQGRRPETDDSTVEVHEGFVVTDDEIKLLLAESNGKHKGKISDPKVPPRQSTTISSKLHRHGAGRGHHEFEHDSCQDEYRNDSQFRARNREYDVQPEIQSDATPRSEGRQFDRNGSVPRDSRHGRLKSEANPPNRWRHCHHLRESVTCVERRSGQSTDSRQERNWEVVIDGNDDDDDNKSRQVSRKKRLEFPPEDHSEHLKGGRLLREATKTTRILQSSEEMDYSVDSDEDDDESTMNGDAGNWSFVSSRSSKDGVFGRGQIRIEKGEGTTGFSLGSSTWYTPEASSTSSGVQPAVVSLDEPVIGNWRKKSNIVLRRSNTALSKCLRELPRASQLKHQDPVIVVFGGMNPDEPLREDLGSAVFRYLPEEDTWELCGHMPQAKSYHASVAVEDSVYIIGGYTLESTFDAEPSASASCFRLDVLAMSWESVAPLNRARACHVAVTAQGRIYVAGGKDKKGRITDSVESYDVSTGRWEQLPNLPRPLMASAAAYFQASFWVLGGVTRSKNTDCRVTDAIYQFDFTDGRWFHSVDLWTPVAYSLAFTTESGGRLWLWGGVTEDGRSLGELRCWSPEHRAWKHCCRLNPPRHGFCGAIVGMRKLPRWQAASERRRRSNDAGKNPVESETLAASSAIQTGANKVHERSASQKLDYPRFDDQSCKKDALEIEGLMPGDVDMDVLEKVAGPRYRGPNIPHQTEGDIVQAHRDYRMLGAVAPPSTCGLDAESEDGIHVLKALERLNQQLLDDKPRTSSLSSEQVVVEQRASEQRSSRPNGKRVPVSQEPLIVPASAATAKAIKPMRRTLSDQDVTPTQGMVTGLKYPYGRTSYEESKQRESRRNGQGRRPETDDSTVEVHEGFVVTDDEIKLLLAESNGKHKGKISDPKVPPRQSTTISSKLHRHGAGRGHHEFEHDSCQDEYRNDSQFRARNREYDVQPEIQSDATPRSEGRQFDRNGSVPRDSRHGRLKSEANPPNRWRHCHHLRESVTCVERRSGQSTDSRQERNWEVVIDGNDDDDDNKSRQVSRKKRLEFPPEDHSEHLKGGRLLREATKTTRILQSSEEMDYSVDSDEDDDESTMNGDAGNWSFVSSRSSKDGVFGRGQIRIEKVSAVPR